MSDIAALAGLSQQGYQKAWDEIPQTLNTILSERRNRTLEQDALETFKDGVTMDKIQSFSQRYPQVPQAQILGIVGQIGKQGEAEAISNAGSSLLSMWAKDPEVLTDGVKLQRFVKSLGLSPQNENTFVNAVLPAFIEQYGQKIKTLQRGERGVSIGFDRKATPVSGMEAETKASTMPMYKRDERGDIIQIVVPIDPKDPQGSVQAYADAGFKPGKVTRGRASTIWEDFKAAYLEKNPKHSPMDAYKAYENMKQTGQKPDKDTDLVWSFKKYKEENPTATFKQFLRDRAQPLFGYFMDEEAKEAAGTGRVKYDSKGNRIK